jgi:hypothetical protein
MKQIEEDLGREIEREQKLKRGWPPFSMKSAALMSDSEMSDHSRHLYTDRGMGRVYVT